MVSECVYASIFVSYVFSWAPSFCLSVLSYSDVLFFSLIIIAIIIHKLVCFVIKDRKQVELDGKVERGGNGRSKKGEMVIRICYVRKKSILNKRKNSYLRVLGCSSVKKHALSLPKALGPIFTIKTFLLASGLSLNINHVVISSTMSQIGKWEGIKCKG